MTEKTMTDNKTKNRRDSFMQARHEVKRAIDLADAEGRVCGDICTMICPVCNSTDCRCMCNRQCAEMRQNLSYAGEDGSLEPVVAPLVFALRRLGCFEPCWSSDGHLGDDGRLRKRPQIWFYTDSLTSLRILGEVVSAFGRKSQTMYDWEIALLPAREDAPIPTFTLRPAAGDIHGKSLAGLRNDIRVMGEHVANEFMKRARAFYAETDLDQVTADTTRTNDQHST